MKIYFAGAIRGGREDAQLYENIIAYLKDKGDVFTEHVGNTNLSWKGEIARKDEEIYNRDMEWLKSADIVIAEVTTPSLGVGYELGIAEKLNIPALCLYRSGEGSRLSAMISGNAIFACRQYTAFIEAQKYIEDFIQSLT
jgi:nucleoside 2-deoxyribosyltransferase